MDKVDPDTVDKVFNDFMCRRAGIIKALTSDSKKFYEQCDPEKDNLCLYGFPEGDWQVNSHMMRVPPELPEPVLGINFARDAMKRNDWLSVVALHSDSWLLSVAFYYGAQARFNSTQRQRLFRLINKMPTVVDKVFETSRQKHNAPFPLEHVKTIDDVFIDFQGRRAGLTKALTTDVEMFYQQCGPEKGNLCLYGFPDGKWEVHPPVEKVPPELPEPALGINFARDAMHEKDWLLFVGFHSDAWLLYMAFYFSARFGFNGSERNRLFKMINQYSTVSETVSQVFDEAAKQRYHN